MGAPVKRDGVTFVAEIPEGAATMFVYLKSGLACVVAPKDAQPYFLFMDGTTKPIEPESEP